MKCPACQNNNTRVVDSRPVDEYRSIRRRRECERCNYRFTTFEKVEETPLVVVKKEGTREEFTREKILRGLIKACEKRPVSLKQLEDLTADVEMELRSQAKIDEVAYVRFASVYRQFKDINVFIEELKELIKKEQS